MKARIPQIHHRLDRKIKPEDTALDSRRGQTGTAGLIEVARELSERYSPIAGEVQSGRPGVIPAVGSGAPCETKVENIKGGTRRDVANRLAHPRPQEILEGHLKADSLVIPSEPLQHALRLAGLDHLERRQTQKLIHGCT